jgi:hypothetical protein
MTSSRSEGELREVYSWAMKIVSEHFRRGLEGIVADAFLAKRYEDFLLRSDPVYATLLEGMSDEALARTFVSYWVTGQTLATQSRFWLEAAITDIIQEQARRQGRGAHVQVYSQPMLSAGYLTMRVTIDRLGEIDREELKVNRPWREHVQSSALTHIDVLVGREERMPRIPPPRGMPNKSNDEKYALVLNSTGASLLT